MLQTFVIGPGQVTNELIERIKVLLLPQDQQDEVFETSGAQNRKILLIKLLNQAVA